MQDLDFPTNHYLFEGFRRYGADIVYVPSDDSIRAPIDRLVDAIDDETALVPIVAGAVPQRLSAGRAPVVEQAHQVGARVVLDVYQAAGTVPMNLEALGVDFAVGGSVKWLCGGPGAGYLYVRQDLRQRASACPTVGWAGHASPFEFSTGADPLCDRDRAVPERHAERAGAGMPRAPATKSSAEIGVPAIRAASLQLTRRLIDAADGARLAAEHADGRCRTRRDGRHRRARMARR